MNFVEENVDELIRTARETWDDPIVQRYLHEIGLPYGSDPIGWPEKLIREMDKHMKSYAGSWNTVTDLHVQEGTYQKIVETFGITDGIHVDLGCGAGGVLTQLPFESWVGVDVNHYCLQAAEKRIKDKGKNVKRLSRSHISFDPKAGFIVKPHPYIFEHDFTEGLLLPDDARNPGNLFRLLYNNGVRADSVTMTLVGGLSCNQGIEFLDQIRQRMEPERAVTAYRLVDEALKVVPRLCRKGGRFLLAIRHAQIEDSKELVVTDGRGKEINLSKVLKAENPELSSLDGIEKYDIQGLEKIQLPDENVSGISVGTAINGYSSTETAEMFAQVGLEKLPMFLYMYELRVK